MQSHRSIVRSMTMLFAGSLFLAFDVNRGSWTSQTVEVVGEPHRDAPDHASPVSDLGNPGDGVAHAAADA